MAAVNAVCVYRDERLAEYGFGAGHPFGPDRLGAFLQYFDRSPAASRVGHAPAVLADVQALGRFHTAAYIGRVQERSRVGRGYLDLGDTPAYPGVYEAAARVVGTALDAVDRIMAGEYRRAFIPIAGLHHAQRDGAAGFCVFNDCGVAILHLRAVHGIRRIAYVDIDAHHGDGVYDGFEDDPQLYFADLHEDGRFLYPGTGGAEDRGRGAAVGSKLNIPLAPGSGDGEFMNRWPLVEAHIDACKPQFILLQCGADSLAGDPITHLTYTPAAHAHAARRLCALADRHCGGRLLALGGGGYNRDNLARAWTAVVEAMVDTPESVQASV